MILVILHRFKRIHHEKVTLFFPDAYPVDGHHHSMWW